MIPGLLPKPDEDIRSPVLRGTSPPAEAGSSVLNRNYPTISKDWIPTCVGMTDLLFALLLETWFGQQAVPPHPPRYGSTATPHAHPRIARVVDWINCNPTCTSQDCAGCRLATRESARGRALGAGQRPPPKRHTRGCGGLSSPRF